MTFLAAHPAVQSEHLAHLYSAVCAAAPISASSVDLFLKRTDGKVLYQEAYGMTEASPLVAMDHVDPAKRKPGSCGPPIPNTNVKIVDTGTGETVKPGNTGEVCVQGPQVMMGYLNNPKATAETIDAEKWMRSGDLGYCDEQGHIYITDRIKELIKVKGFQVAPAELEEVLRTHPGVQDAAVVGIPDERSGEVPRAFVVRSDPSISEANIMKYVKSRVAPFKRLSGGIVFLDSIPKTASGKILRRDLKKSAI